MDKGLLGFRRPIGSAADPSHPADRPRPSIRHGPPPGWGEGPVEHRIRSYFLAPPAAATEPQSDFCCNDIPWLSNVYPVFLDL